MPEITGVVYALVASMFFSSESIMARKGMISLDKASVGVLLTFSTSVPTFLILALAFGEYGRLATLHIGSVAILAAAGVGNFAVGRSFRYASIRFIGAGRGNPLSSTSMLHSAFLGIVLLSERVSASLILGIALILAGVSVISRSEAGKGRLAIDRRALAKGIPLGLVSGLFYGVTAFLMKVGVESVGSPIISTLLAYLFATLALSSILFRRRNRTMIRALSRPSLAYFLLGGLLINFAQLFRFTALSAAPLSIVEPLVSTMPVFAFAFSLIFIRGIEFLNVKVLIGVLTVVAGATLVSSFL